MLPGGTVPAHQTVRADPGMPSSTEQTRPFASQELKASKLGCSRLSKAPKGTGLTPEACKCGRGGGLLFFFYLGKWFFTKMI